MEHVAESLKASHRLVKSNWQRDSHQILAHELADDLPDGNWLLRLLERQLDSSIFLQDEDSCTHEIRRLNHNLLGVEALYQWDEHFLVGLSGVLDCILKSPDFVVEALELTDFNETLAYLLGPFHQSHVGRNALSELRVAQQFLFLLHDRLHLDVVEQLLLGNAYLVVVLLPRVVSKHIEQGDKELDHVNEPDHELNHLVWLVGESSPVLDVEAAGIGDDRPSEKEHEKEGNASDQSIDEGFGLAELTYEVVGRDEAVDLSLYFVRRPETGVDLDLQVVSPLDDLLQLVLFLTKDNQSHHCYGEQNADGDARKLPAEVRHRDDLSYHKDGTFEHLRAVSLDVIGDGGAVVDDIFHVEGVSALLIVNLSAKRSVLEFGYLCHVVVIQVVPEALRKPEAVVLEDRDPSPLAQGSKYG